jgi:hypothetical protein
LVDDEGEEDAVFELRSESEEYDLDDVLPIKKKIKIINAIDLCHTPLLDNNIVDLIRHAND